MAPMFPPAQSLLHYIVAIAVFALLPAVLACGSSTPPEDRNPLARGGSPMATGGQVEAVYFGRVEAVTGGLVNSGGRLGNAS